MLTRILTLTLLVFSLTLSISCGDDEPNNGDTTPPVTGTDLPTASPTPVPSPTPAPAKTWRRLKDVFHTDKVEPEQTCDHPTVVEFERDGDWEARLCARNEDGELEFRKIEGRLTATELAELGDLADAVSGVVTRSRRICDDTQFDESRHFLDLTISTRRKFRIWDMHMDRGLCIRGPVPNVERLHDHVHALIGTYLPKTKL